MTNCRRWRTACRHSRGKHRWGPALQPGPPRSARPGIGMYGVAPPHTTMSGLWPVLSLKTRIVALREVPAGTGISYGSRVRVGSRARIATLPIGYADGYTRRMSGQAQVLCGGRRCPVLGPITMDMCMVDVSSVPHVEVGDEVVLIGAQRGRDGQHDQPITPR